MPDPRDRGFYRAMPAVPVVADGSLRAFIESLRVPRGKKR